jgi:tRNA threonylcarbamoyladenosine biosynthesis protein TsaE
MYHISIADLTSIEDAARELLNAFPERKIFAFYGEMGAGKTTFIKALCRILKVSDVTSSPSFGLIHEYRTTGNDYIYHFDFYRIEKVEEVFDIGYEEYIYSGRYCFIEWPEKIESVLPPETVRTIIHVTENDERTVDVEA